MQGPIDKIFNNRSGWKFKNSSNFMKAIYI